MKIRCVRLRGLEDPNSIVSKIRRQMDEEPPAPQGWQTFVEQTNRRMDDMGRRLDEMTARLQGSSTQLQGLERGMQLVLNMLARNGMGDAEGSVFEQRSDPGGRSTARQREKSHRTREWARGQVPSAEQRAVIVREALPDAEQQPVIPTEPRVAPPPIPTATPAVTLTLPPRQVPVTPPPRRDPLPPSPSQAPPSPSSPPPRSPSPTHSPSIAREVARDVAPPASPPPPPAPPMGALISYHSQTPAPSEDVDMDIGSSPSPAGPTVVLQEPTPKPRPVLDNLQAALDRLQQPPPRMTRLRAQTPEVPLRRSARSKSRSAEPEGTKGSKRKALSDNSPKGKRAKK